ncbi:MAG: Response regulator ArlR [Candidatus Heimdallarchaeota archaeon LC_3]|nr:MAG: Response regulator ArlR [Candidatus Heimdallarchaeota archaeon LC_3]
MKRQISRILLIEDDKDQGDLVRFSIEEKKLPYQLDISLTGREGLEKIFNNHYDVIFVDYRLPDLDGLEVLKRIRRNQESTGNYTPVIIITGGGSEKVAVEAMRNGAFDYIIKSFDYQNLIPKILDDLESYYSDKFSLDEIHLLVFKKARAGPDIHTSTPNLPFRQPPDNILPKIGVSLFFLVGMGESYNEGLFGPVPISDEEEFSALVYATFIADEALTDDRMKGRNYVLVCLVFPKTLVQFFSSRREDVESFFRKFSNQYSDIKYIDKEALIELRKEFYAPLHQVRMELELSYRNKQLKEQKFQNYEFSKKLSEKIIEISDKLSENISEDGKRSLLRELKQIGSDSNLIVSLNNYEKINYEKIKLDDWLKTEVINLKSKIPIKVETKFGKSDDTYLEIDKSLLIRFISNIIINSIQMDGKSLDIVVKSEDFNYTRFEFISNGLSINKNQFPHFFDPFFLVNEKLGLSSNLGLVLVNEIIKAHHGRIWIEYSKDLTAGLTIIALFPKRKTI